MSSATPCRRSLCVPVLAALLSAALPATASAQTPPASSMWATLGVPGTPAALAWAVGLNADAKSITPEWVMFEAIRALHGEPDSTRVRGFEAYLRHLNRFDADRRALGPSLSLSMVTERDSRERLDSFLRTVGLEVTNGPRVEGTRDRVQVVARRTDATSQNNHAMLLAAGVPLAGLEERLNAGEAIPSDALVLPWFDVPLPMYAEWWSAILGPEAEPFSSILSDRRASLLYYGVSSLDTETRTYLSTRAPLIEVLLDHAGTFAAYGGNLRVRNGRVDVPGGADLEAWWEALVDAPVAAPDQFIARLLEARSGRLAYFYSLLDSISPAQRRFITGLSTPPATRPADVFAWFDRGEAGFAPDDRPFARPFNDPMLFVTGVTVNAEGQPAGPSWRYLWDAVFDDLRLPQDTVRVLRPSAAQVDAPYLLNAVFGSGMADPRVRLNTVLFAQRVFADAPQESVSDLLIALRGFQRFPMLCLTLERAGVRSPAVYAAAVRMADVFSAIDDSERAFAALSQYQGVIALVELAARSRRISGEQAGALIESLSSVPVDRHGSFGGDIARWLDTVMLPAVSAPLPVSGSAPLERALLAGLARLPEVVEPVDPRARGASFDWQGWQYQADPSRALYARMTAVRQRQAGNSLDAILRLSRVTAALSTDVTLETVAAQRQALTELPGELREPQIPVAVEGPGRVEVASTLRSALQDLDRITEPRRLNNVERIAARLHALTSALTADLLRAMVYAASIPDPQSAQLSAGDISHQHDLGVTSRYPAEREGIGWGFPERLQGGQGTVRARGSLLALDLAMADLGLGQTFLDRFEPPANWTFEDLRIYVQALALFNPLDPRLEQTPQMLSAIAAGRSRLSGQATDPVALGQSLHLAGVSPLRRALVTLTAPGSPSTAESLLSLTELLRLGGDADAVRAGEAWGASALVLNGCLCLTTEPAVSWDHYGGRGGVWGFLGARSSDLLLRLAEGLSRMNVPPEVAADVLPAAMRSMFDRTSLAHEDDWLGLVRASAFTPTRIAPFIESAKSGRSLFPSQGR